MPAMKPRKAEKSRAPTTAGEAAKAPATASEGALPTVSGTGPGEWNDSLLAGIVQVCAGRDLGAKGAVAKARAGIAAMNGIGPDDVIADMVAAQLVLGASRGNGLLQARGRRRELVVWREALNQANRLSRTSAALIEALNRHRGKGSQQRVVVEHVKRPPAGGQANRPAPSRPGEGGGDDPETGNLCHAPSPAVRCENAARDAMQGPRDARPEAMQDARREAVRRPTRQPLRVEAWRLHSRGDRTAPRSRRAGALHAPSNGRSIVSDGAYFALTQPSEASRAARPPDLHRHIIIDAGAWGGEHVGLPMPASQADGSSPRGRGTGDRRGPPLPWREGCGDHHGKPRERALRCEPAPVGIIRGEGAGGVGAMMPFTVVRLHVGE